MRALFLATAIAAIGFMHCVGSIYASSLDAGWHWDCSYNNGRSCKVCNDTSSVCRGGVDIDDWVSDKINIRNDWQLQNDTIASNTEKLNNNFTNEIANLTAAANTEIESANAAILSDIDSITARNNQLREFLVIGANVTTGDLES